MEVSTLSCPALHDQPLPLLLTPAGLAQPVEHHLLGCNETASNGTAGDQPWCVCWEEGLASGWLDLEGAWGSLHSANPVFTPLHMFPPMSHTVRILDRTLMRSASGSCGDTGGRRAGMTFLLRPREVNHAHFPGMDPQRSLIPDSYFYGKWT